VYEVGEAGGVPYCALEFIAGGTLADRIAGRPLQPRDAARLVAQLARAVQHAHDRGVLHRDLKPANVLLAADGTPKIADFGLAKRLEADSGERNTPARRPTRTGSILGTPAYMAPEQAGGGGKYVGPPADVYALGAVLYECLTGRPPFSGPDTFTTLMQVIEREPVRPRAVNPAVPKDLETVCLAAMAKDADRRYASAAALADDLDRFLDGKPVTARPVGRFGRATRSCRRNPVAVLAAVAVAVAVGLLTMQFRTPSPSHPADDSLARVQRAGVLKVATDPTYPPMEFVRDGQVVGFDADLVRQLAERLDVRAEFVSAAWDWHALAGRLAAHEFDILASCVTATDERAADVDFVVYLPLAQVYVGRKGVFVRHEADLAGKIVAVQRDTTAQRLVEDVRRRGVAVKDLLVLPNTRDPFDAVLSGRAEVMMAHEPVARYAAKQDPRLTVLGQIGHTLDPEPVGLAFAPTDKELQAAVAQALKALKHDGTFGRLLDEWFGP
jgi:ABC-type amino acid transport substrate-binding protein